MIVVSFDPLDYRRGMTRTERDGSLGTKAIAPAGFEGG